MSEMVGFREADLAQLTSRRPVRLAGAEWRMIRVPAGRRRLAELSDSQLMLAIQAGDVRCLGELYDRYCNQAYRIALSVCRDRGHAEDAVQNAFVSIWSSRSSYQAQRGTVSAWLLATVHHRAVDITRKSGSRDAKLASEDKLEDCCAPDDTCEQVLARDETQLLRALLGRLPAAQREVITLAFYGGLSHTEIARQLGIPSGTVKGRMRLGLRRLRADMEPVSV
jgi:RNA polymerase sigma-70 factor, ECF subfamily